MTTIDDKLEALMRHSLRGDARAHELLLRALAPVLRSYFFKRLTSRPSDVEDLVQEALIAVHTRRATFEPARPLMPWVFAIAKYKFVDYLRRARAMGQSVELTEDAKSVEFDPAVSARLDIETMLASLPEKQSRALRSMQIDGESAAKTAARFGWSESDAKVSAHRGLKTLRTRFAGISA